MLQDIQQNTGGHAADSVFPLGLCSCFLILSTFLAWYMCLPDKLMRLTIQEKSHFLSVGNKPDMVYLTRRARPESALWWLIIQTTMMVIFPRWYREAQETFLSVYCAAVCVNSPQLISVDQQSRSAWNTGSESWAVVSRRNNGKQVSYQSNTWCCVFPQKVKRIEYLIKLYHQSQSAVSQ